MKKKEIFINNHPYSINHDDYIKLESVQEELQELVNQNKFKSDDYNNLTKLFATFLRTEIRKVKIKDKEVESDIFYYTY